jgi:hypothetical protein
VAPGAFVGADSESAADGAEDPPPQPLNKASGIERQAVKTNFFMA